MRWDILTMHNSLPILTGVTRSDRSWQRSQRSAQRGNGKAVCLRMFAGIVSQLGQIFRHSSAFYLNCIGNLLLIDPQYISETKHLQYFIEKLFRNLSYSFPILYGVEILNIRNEFLMKNQWKALFSSTYNTYIYPKVALWPINMCSYYWCIISKVIRIVILLQALQFSAGGPYESPRTLVPRTISIYFGWYEIQRLASIDLHFKEHIKTILLSILKKLLIVGSSKPSHLVFGILRFRTNIKAFR